MWGLRYLQIVEHIPSFRHHPLRRQVRQWFVYRPLGESIGWPQGALRIAGDGSGYSGSEAAVSLSKAFNRNMNVRFLSVERLINATIKQVDQQPTVNKLATKLLREHGPINWPNRQTGKQPNDACSDALGHFSSNGQYGPATAQSGHVIQRCDSCQMVMVIRIRLAVPKIRLRQTHICMYDVTAIAWVWRLMVLLKTSSLDIETGLAGWQPTPRTIQFNSIFNCLLPIAVYNL